MHYLPKDLSTLPPMRVSEYMAAKKRTAKKRTAKRARKANPVEKAMKAARQASAKRIMAQWHEKSAKLNAECQLALNRLKQTSKAAKSVVKLRTL